MASQNNAKKPEKATRRLGGGRLVGAVLLVVSGVTILLQPILIASSLSLPQYPPVYVVNIRIESMGELNAPEASKMATTKRLVKTTEFVANAEDATAKENSAKQGLNVIVLYPDDMRHDSFGAAQTQIVETPFLDSLATKGMRFTHNCVTTSVCWISRATLFSGQYNSRHGAQYLFRPIGPAAWNHTYPALLREAGYYLGHVGKWQYRNEAFTYEAFDFVSLLEGKHVFKHNGALTHVTDKNQEDAIRFLQTRPKDRNFALQVAFYAPKAVGKSEMPWTPMEKTSHMYNNVTLKHPVGMNESFWRLPPFFTNNESKEYFEARSRWKHRFGTPERYDASMKAYFRMITEVDQACAAIYKELEAQGIANETMIIFTSDNGFFHAEHGLAGKWFPYQESIRVPLIIHDPRMPTEARGTTSDEYTLNIDLASTILGAAGLETHPLMQGRDIADLYLPTGDKSPWRKEFYYEWPGQGANRIPASNALVRKDFKLFHYPEWNLEQLFNLKEDPLEEYDVINNTEHAELVVEMRKRYYELQELSK
jgi:arylsulfatase